jgi:hypothetical protein
MVLLAGILRVEIIGTEERAIPVPVADVLDAWRVSEEGPCARTCLYGPRGNPPCADCRLAGTEEMPPSATRLARRSAA